MKSRTTTVVVLLGIAAIGSWYLARSQPQSQLNDLAYEASHRGYYLTDARILGTGADGSLLYEIEAARAEQQEDKSIEFSDVRIRYAAGSEIPWNVKADAATLRSGNALLILRGHVQITNSTASSDDETEIRTSYLELDPQRFIADTDERVQIRFGSRSVTATGMLASLDDDKIQLKANVRGKIAP